ncbi:MAG: aminotransferase class I/II-fold pyridoxal phosphate-dependent enzyme [Alphaproteobacteria bacterium]|nr:aminotransferase class I/II-fold pyridoxal phosphate-dependent enzyme [Alphaproteobacteria bacterium]
MNHAAKPASLISSLEDSPIIEIVRVGRSVEDIVPLWLGESGFATDEAIIAAAHDAMTSGQTFYTPNRGLPRLRQSISDYYQRIYGTSVADDRVCVTNSGMHAATMITRALMDTGDNAILITPCWPNIDRAVKLIGGTVREVPLQLHDGQYRVDMDQVVAQCDDRTRLIYFASPSNPTGWTIGTDQSQELLALSRRTGIAILSDEVYQRLSFDSETGSTLLSLAEPDDPVFVLNSFSKAWSMTGWRLGWMVYPAQFHDSFEKLSQFSISGSPGFIQMAGVQALDHGDPIAAGLRAHCMDAKSLVADRLAAIPDISVVPSLGGFYTMFRSPQTADSVAFCRQAALEARVGLAPGVAFGDGGEGMVRLCHARAMATLETALDRLQAYLGAAHRESA